MLSVGMVDMLSVWMEIVLSVCVDVIGVCGIEVVLSG